MWEWLLWRWILISEAQLGLQNFLKIFEGILLESEEKRVMIQMLLKICNFENLSLKRWRIELWQYMMFSLQPRVPSSSDAISHQAADRQQTIVLRNASRRTSAKFIEKSGEKSRASTRCSSAFHRIYRRESWKLVTPLTGCCLPTIQVPRNSDPLERRRFHSPFQRDPWLESRVNNLDVNCRNVDATWNYRRSSLDERFYGRTEFLILAQVVYWDGT